MLVVGLGMGTLRWLGCGGLSAPHKFEEFELVIEEDFHRLYNREGKAFYTSLVNFVVVGHAVGIDWGKGGAGEGE